MKRFSLVLFILAAISCTHTPKYPLPDTPKFSTSAGQNCAIKCRQTHYECKLACQDSKREQSQCISKCNKELGKCYGLCKEMLE